MQRRDYVSRLGEKCGPLVTAETVQRIVQNLPKDKKSFGNFDSSLEEYLNTFPGPNSPEVVKVLAEFDALVPVASAAREKAKEQPQDAKNKRANKKKEKVAALEQQVREMVPADVSLGPWAEVAGVSVVAHHLLIPFQNGPSKATKKKLKRIIAEICQAFAPVPHNLAGLSFLRTESSSKFERYIAGYVEDSGGAEMVGNMSQLELTMVHAGLLREAVLFHASGIESESRGCINALVKVAKEEISSELSSNRTFDVFAENFYKNRHSQSIVFFDVCRRSHPNYSPYSWPSIGRKRKRASVDETEDCSLVDEALVSSVISKAYEIRRAYQDFMDNAIPSFLRECEQVFSSTLRYVSLDWMEEGGQSSVSKLVCSLGIHGLREVMNERLYKLKSIESLDYLLQRQYQRLLKIDEHECEFRCR